MSDRKKTKSVRLSEEQIKALGTLAERERRDISELIRIAIDQLLSSSTNREIAVPVQIP